MSRILMIRPSDRITKAFKSSMSPPLGLMSLAAWARKARPGKDQFHIVHEHLNPKTLSEWTELVRDWRPDCIAFSAMTLEAARMKELSRHFKEHFPHISLIAGGPCASSMGASLLELTCLDAIFKGEGEVAFVQWLEAFETQGACPQSPIPGMVCRSADGRVRDSDGVGRSPEIDELPIPAWDLVDIHAYKTQGRMTQTDNGTLYAPLFNSRGCPYGCIFCHKIFLKKFRAMDAARVVDELQFHLENHGVRSFEVFDDIFNLDYDRAMEVFALIRQRNLDIEISFPNGVRGDLLDEPMIRAMRQAGVYSMAFAVESASPRLQRMTKKNIDLEKIRKNIRLAQESGIFTWGFFMLGFPGETFRELLQTIWFAVTSRLHGAFFFSVIPFEGTELSEMVGMKKEKEIKEDRYDYMFSKNHLSALGPTSLSILQFLAFITFYSYPFRLWRIYRDWPRGTKELILKFCKVCRYVLWFKPLGHYQALLLRLGSSFSR